MTANFRATATLSLRSPLRFASLMSQALRADHFSMRCRSGSSTQNDAVARQLFGGDYILDLQTHVPTLGKDLEQSARDQTETRNCQTCRQHPAPASTIS
jgi:hypothetical protein